MKRSMIAACVCVLLFSCDEKDGGGEGTAVPVSSSNSTSTAQQPVAPTTASTTGRRLNPPHGEPGHRCEIGVGEPLPEDGATPPPANPQEFIQGNPLDVTTTMVDPGQAPPTNSVKLPSGTPNPAHGAPGHDCNVQVGQPLP
jgi:hypothetical protein